MNRRGAIKVAVLALLVGGVAVLYFSPARTYLTKEHLRDLITWLRGLWYGPIVLIALYAAGCIFAIPASVFVIAGGVIWGWKLGAVYAITGGMLGAVASYFVGGFLGEGLLEKFGSAGRATLRALEPRNGHRVAIIELSFVRSVDRIGALIFDAPADAAVTSTIEITVGIPARWSRVTTTTLSGVTHPKGPDAPSLTTALRAMETLTSAP